VDIIISILLKLGVGAHLKELRRAEGDAKFFGVFRVKNHDFTAKNHILSNLRGGARRVRPSLGFAPESDINICN
jgi:hypothetical protein